jgi:glycosyltransferase involved in cell wall biosynthesis
MDDCSPDNTDEVARSFNDTRVRYIRNDPNLGSLRNYNKGITLSRGKYIWLISADDYLRYPCILERYVGVMEVNPRVGFGFCPGVSIRNGKETGILKFSVCGNRDRIIPGHALLTEKLLAYNAVLAAAGMVRRDCYEKISMFPMENGMVWTGDWYLWCVFALYYDAAYFAEPMVCYREHNLSMTSQLRSQNSDALVVGNIAVPWMIKHKADAAGFRNLSRPCLRAVARQYARHVALDGKESPQYSVSLEQFEDSLYRHTDDETERNWVRAWVYSEIADRYYHCGDFSSARRYYQQALQKNPLLFKVHVKCIFLSLGKTGDWLRKKFARKRVLGH